MAAGRLGQVSTFTAVFGKSIVIKATPLEKTRPWRSGQSQNVKYFVLDFGVLICIFINLVFLSSYSIFLL
jgi:hypothetical protein